MPDSRTLFDASGPRCVINVRTAPAGSFIYVGRAMPGRFAGHPLANPFRLPRKATAVDRVECIEKYREWLSCQPWIFAHGLADEVAESWLPLGCWCAPELCHADVLTERVKGLLRGWGVELQGAWRD